jgi:hypothetical protein
MQHIGLDLVSLDYFLEQAIEVRGDKSRLSVPGPRQSK